MPTTVNGIGTHYYGRKNVTKRPGPCPFCRRGVELTSYDTRLWFVVVFIPIIPLGRKRIIDQCASCRRHYVVEMQKWETAKQLEISGAQEEFRKNPTPEGAMAVHAQLLKYHQRTEAAQLREEMLRKFPHNARIEAYLGAALEHEGQPAEAARHYENALSLRPDLPDARIGVARARQREGRLDEARKLLDFLEKTGAAQLYSLLPLELLAIAYQKAGQHQEALELFGKLQTELPKLADVKAFRDRVKRSEKALGRGDSMLPKQKFSLKRAFTVQGAGGSLRPLVAVGVIAGLIILGFTIVNEYKRRHRTIYIVSEFARQATVEVSGFPSVTLARNSGLRELKVPEGRYHASIKGPVQQEVDFEVRSGYFSRWGDDPVWLINVGGATPLLFQTVTYARNPPPAVISIHCGQVIEHFPDVTHPFTEMPESVQMKETERRVLTHLELFRHEGPAIFEFLTRTPNSGDALKFAESYLAAHNEDSDLIQAYVVEGKRRHEAERVERCLRSGLTNRPVGIEWHRNYQRLHDNTRELPQLTAAYDGFLKAEPSNSALLYLRGRIDRDRRQAREFLQKATVADPKNAYAAFGLGYDRLMAGDWVEAQKLLARAVEFGPADGTFRHWFSLARLAAGEAAAVAHEAEERLKQKPGDGYTEIEILYALAVQGRGEEAVKHVDEFQKQALAKFGNNARSATEHLRWLALYAAGDFAGLEKTVASDSTPEGRRMVAEALLEQGRADPAVKFPDDEDRAEAEAVWFLARSVAAHNAGSTVEAAEWRRKATESMAHGNSDLEQAAQFLSRSTPPTPVEVEEIVMVPYAKAVFLLALSQAFPQASAELQAVAGKFNFEPHFPYHLVKRSIEKTANSKPQATL